ncbi:MAG: hypothetical protein K6T75_04185 [Acetobacteraceae bacterium]|nr:hypothetical protein [Acetobacteraceae bacterium]
MPGEDEGLDVTDLILLLLHAHAHSAQGRIPPEIHGSTRLQKLLFLAVNEMPGPSGLGDVAKSLGFRPYHYGPFSERVEDSVAFLESMKLVEVTRVGRGSLMERLEQWEASHPFEVSDESQAIYRLTRDGVAVADKLKAMAGHRTWEFLCRMVKKYGGMRLGELLFFVYDKYPEMATRSRLKPGS